MRLFAAAVLLLGAVATANGNTLLVEDGKEYVYATSASASAGTMDVASTFAGFAYKMKTRVQVSGRTMNIKFEDLEFTQYNGQVQPREWPYDKTTFRSVPANPEPFSVKFSDDGLFQELVVPSGASLFERNLMRSWAAQMQVNTGEIKNGKRGFKSREQLLHGACDVTYTVDSAAIRKSVSTTEDCENRVHRIIDDYRGFRCDSFGKMNPPYPSSVASTVYVLDKEGDRWQVKALISTGTWIAQFYETEGSSQMVHTNSTSKLVEVKGSSGDISASGSSITDLSFEWADKDYKWDVDRDLKAREPTLGSGEMFTDSPAVLKQAIKAGIAKQKQIAENLDTSEDSLKNAHRYGINNLLPAFYALDYASLKEVAEELLADKSDAGVSTSNVFNELLSSAGTTAAALVIRDLVLENKFPNDRDAARALTGIPYHIRRPNTQLVREFEQLIDADLPRFVKMSAPLVLGHLIRMTCERAGPMGSDESRRCFKDFASQYVNKGWEKYQGTSDRETKSLVLASLMNIRFGGQSTILKDLIAGKVDAEDTQLRSQALWAAGWEALASGQGAKYFLPLFSDRSLDHELRIAALEMIFYTRPSASEISNLITVLYAEKDYEVVNYAYTLFERWANAIDPCSQQTGKLARYFLKYMRQFSQYESDWGFGVSRSYQRQYFKKKYGYGGKYLFYVIGSKKSTMPITIGAGMGNSFMNTYQNYLLSVHLRLEGVSKALVKKFKTTDPSTWKTSDLEQILSGDMNIRARPDQPVRAQISIMLKGNVIFHRSYDETSTREGGRISNFIDTLKGLGDTYSINHQRAVQIGGLLYEQPTNLGIPLTSYSSVTTAGSIRATVKRGNHRGLLYRDVEYDMHFLTQANRVTFVAHPMRKAGYGVVNDRIYHAHFPRRIVVGVNPIKKEIKLSVSRPELSNPWRLFMHSVTYTRVRGTDNLQGNYDALQQNCPDCENVVLVSKGPGAVRSRSFIDRENERRGSKIFGQYFGCEMDVSRGRTVAHLLGALAPYNKQPKTAWTSVMMGIRQIRTFFFYFPRTEQCGAELQWSQSSVNPVKEIEVSIRANMEKNGERLFFRGRKWFIKALIKAKGEPADRSYRVNVAYEFTPGNLQNKLKVQLNRAPVSALGVEPYSVCFALENKYPDFSKEFLGYDENNDMKVTGKAMLQYGEGTTCADGEGEVQVKFEHSTTQEARQDLQDKWYYKQCMALKNSPQWAGRTTLPVSEACYMTVWDATSARRYTWDIDLVKLSPRMQRILNRIQTMVKAGLFPYWDVDPDELGADGEIGPFLNIDATFKDSDKALDIEVESRAGTENFNDIPLRLDWTKRLRNLKFTPTLKKLFDSKIINPCIVTNADVRTNDNVTYAYEPSNCWTLASSACGPDPAYAVFTKTSTSKPLAARIYVGGHSVELEPSGGGVSVSVNGNSVSIADQDSHEHNQDGVEIFKIFRWGSSYHVYSFLRVWVAYDGNFVETVPAPSAKGQHCGLCGNYNRNKWDEFTGKDMQQLPDAAAMVSDWQWQC